MSQQNIVSLESSQCKMSFKATNRACSILSYLSVLKGDILLLCEIDIDNVKHCIS